MERPKVCIFCGEKSLTKEHIFPDWLKGYVPQKNTPAPHLLTFKGIDPTNLASKILVTPGKMHHRPGAAHTHGLRVVCAKCNNGWMSVLQSRSKPIILPLILGEWNPMSEKDRETLAAWATMFVSVAQFSNSLGVAIEQQERSAFMASMKPAQNWYIWMAATTGKKFLTDYIIKALGRLEVDQTAKRRDFVGESHCAVLMLGRLVIHTVSSTNPRFLSFVSSHYNAGLKLTPIWPPYKGLMEGPPFTISDEGLVALAFAPDVIFGKMREMNWHGGFPVN